MFRAEDYAKASNRKKVRGRQIELGCLHSILNLKMETVLSEKSRASWLFPGCLLRLHFDPEDGDSGDLKISIYHLYNFDRNRTTKDWNRLPADVLASFPCKLNTFRKRLREAVTTRSKEALGGV
jgi:hypothetical protein